VLAEGVSAAVVLLPAGTDPDAFVRSKGAEAMESLLRDRLDAVEFVETLHRLEASQMTVEEALHTLRDLLAVVPDPIVRRLLVQRAAERFRFDEAILAGEVERVSGGRGSRGPVRPAPLSEKASRAARASPPGHALPAGLERDLILSLWKEPSLLNQMAELLQDQALSAGTRQAVGCLRRWQEAGAVGDPGRILDEVEDPAVRSVLSEALIWETEAYSDRERSRAARDIPRQIGMALRKERLRLLDEEIERASRAGAAELGDLLRERQRLQAEQAGGSKD
jgi:DNA primase